SILTKPQLVTMFLIYCFLRVWLTAFDLIHVKMLVSFYFVFIYLFIYLFIFAIMVSCYLVCWFMDSIFSIFHD
ncbi:hypothetical protein ACMBCM_09475, partial [Spiroplasma sp. K1]